MGKKYFIGLAITVVVAASSATLAQEPEIQYPVAELGNCQNETSCKSYCDQPENLSACLDFAKKNNLMSEEELATAEKFEAAGGQGPGGCTGKDSCEAYCNDISHIDECVAFAEKNNLMSPKDLEEAKKVQAAIAKGVKPPPCGSKTACDAYCEESDHMEECITFGAEAGFIQGKELEDAQKMLQAVKRGVKPPPCKGKEACDEYCSAPENMETCINFAMEAGFMNDEEKAGAQKMMEALKKGVKPLPCKGKEACDEYCQQDEHSQECIAFAEAAGFMSPEDAAIARKTGGKGPGGCKGKEECESFCNNPDNQETCFNFAKENGLMPEEDLKQMEQGKQQMEEALNQMPPAVLECLSSRVGPDRVEKIKQGAAMPSKEVGDAMQACFQETGAGPQTGPSRETMEQGGPGGCKTPEECQAFCQQNPQDCENFKPSEEWPEGQPKGDEIMPPKQTGPGGCQSEEECQAYCASNPQACGAPAPSEGQEQFQEQFQGQQGPPLNQQPPMEQQPQQPQVGNPPPSPPSEPLSPGSIINIFKKLIGR